MSYKPEVIADSSGQWAGNGLAFETEAEAREWVTDLSYRWTLVRDVRVVESTELVNYRMENGRAISMEAIRERERKCASNHWNNGQDICADCGADLNVGET